MQTYKKYRVDVFKDNAHTSENFNDRVNAAAYANKETKYGIVFLLKHIAEGKYDIVREVKPE